MCSAQFAPSGEISHYNNFHFPSSEVRPFKSIRINNSSNIMSNLLQGVSCWLKTENMIIDFFEIN